MNKILVGITLLALSYCMFPEELIQKYQVEILSEGESRVKPNTGDEMKIHYEGSLKNGKVFDSSYERSSPISIRVGTGQVIKCWDEVALHLPVGWKIRVLCPYQSAYGDRGMGSIPAKSDLIFIMERKS